MPTFQGEQADNYDQRIVKLIPGYDLLHTLTAAQLVSVFPDEAKILVIGAGTGKEIIELAKVNSKWTFIAQDVSSDMLAIADQNFTKLGISSRVDIHVGDINEQHYQADVALCLLVLHFLKDDGSKKQLLKQINKQLKQDGLLLIADLEKPMTSFERPAQLTACQWLGLTDVGRANTELALEREFYPLDKMRFAELLAEAGFDTPKLYFKALGFAAHSCKK
ncbi:class I SAM-dependent methyltransferase (plasmid) [Pseudoalteromonas sp. T1lg65]|uniref:class I SAM-dependent methyltransferase n=1 Tax=Pseudoalteromonas sp. T1lg65 TaxID=2077101 RepID=UPI003F7B0969